MFRNSRFHFLSGAAIAALVTLAVVCVAFAFAPAFTVAVGNQDAIVYRNFHDLETVGGRTFRWTTGGSSLALPQVGRPGIGVLHLNVWLPETRRSLDVTVSVARRPLLTLPATGLRHVSLLVPASTVVAGDPHLGLSAPTWSTPGDPRPLGIAVMSVTWDPLGLSLAPARQLWVLPVVAFALALLLVRLSCAPVAAALSATAIGSGLALAAGLRPLSVAPYTHRVLLVIVLAHGVLLLWKALMYRGEGRWSLPSRVDLISLLVLIGVAYWSVLIFQWALSLEVGSSVSPRPGQQIIGAPALLLLCAVAWVPRLRPALRGRIALAILALGAVANGLYSAAFSFRRYGPDFFIIWRAAYDFHLGRPLYKLDDVISNHFGHVYKVPPFYGMLFVPFATADDNLVLFGYRILNVLLYLAAGALLAWLLHRRLAWPIAAAATVLVMGLLQPAYDTLAYGQIDIVLLLLLVVALVALRTDRPWLAGLAIALGALFKLYPLLLAAFLLARRQWRALASVILWLIALDAISVAVMGSAAHVTYVTKVLPNIGGGTGWVENQTINGFLSRLFTGAIDNAPLHNRAVDLLTYAVFAVLAGIAFLLAMAQTPRDTSRFALQFSSFVVVMVVAIPAAWMHYSTIMAVPFVVLLWHTAEHPLTLRQAAALALSFSLIAYGNQWSFFTGTLNPGLPLLALSYKCYGLVVLWLVVVTAALPAWEARGIKLRSHARPPAERTSAA